MKVSDAIKEGLFTKKEEEVLKRLQKLEDQTCDEILLACGGKSRQQYLNMLILFRKMGVVASTEKGNGKRLVWSVTEETDRERITSVKSDRRRADRRRRAVKRGEPMRPTKEELETAAREIMFAKQYFVRSSFMVKIADWLKAGARL
jgi:hypothetical protein